MDRDRSALRLGHSFAAFDALAEQLGGGIVVPLKSKEDRCGRSAEREQPSSMGGALIAVGGRARSRMEGAALSASMMRYGLPELSGWIVVDFCY